MKIIVPVKRVLDFNLKPRVKPDGSGVDLSNVKMGMNPFDEIALEEAIRLKEKSLAEEVVAVSIGIKQAQETLRTALALGADRAIHIHTQDHTADIEPLVVAKILHKLCEDETPDMIICGKQAIDNDMNATGQMLAARLGWPQATFASQIQIKDGAAQVTREIDGGLQVLQLPLPALVTVDLRLNEPRHASLPNIMKAKKKPMQEMNISDLGIDISARLDVISITEPATRSAGIMVTSVDELLTQLKQLGAVQ